MCLARDVWRECRTRLFSACLTDQTQVGSEAAKVDKGASVNRHFLRSGVASTYSMPRRAFVKAVTLAGTASFFSAQTKAAGGSIPTAENDGTLSRLTGPKTDLKHHILLKSGTI